jgi:CRISPR-associated protein Cas5
MQVDLTPIFEKAELNNRAMLVIESLSPISMVSEIPGSHYKTSILPSKHQLCGLFENLLGWHIGLKHRKELLKKLKEIYKKSYKIDLDIPKSNSGYDPLVYHLFDIDSKGVTVQPAKIHFDDLWKKAFRRTDAVVHPKGTPNLDYSMVKIKRELSRKKDKPEQVDDKELEKLFKANLGKFPFYYATLASREYILAQGSWYLTLLIDSKFLSLLQNSIKQNSLAYMGTSDSWVDIKIEIL